MPITIGPFDNVPAPGDPIRSPWAQEISQYAYDLNVPIQNATPSGKFYTAPLWSGRLMIVGGYGAFSTDAAGVTTIPYGQTFAVEPLVMAAQNLQTKGATVSPTAVTNTYMQVMGRWTTTGAAVGNDVLDVWWIAIGQRP